MAEVITITDGTDSVTFTNSGSATGFWVNAWQPSIGPLEAPDSIVAEKLTVTLKGSSQDNLAAQVVALNRILKHASDFHARKNGIIKPVYLQVQGSAETNARFATIFSGLLSDFPPIHEYEVTNNNILIGGTLTIQREAAWRNGAPNVRPTPITLTATDGAANGANAFISNFRDNSALTVIKNSDGGVFSADLLGDNDFTYWASTPAVGDIIYFGSDGPFHNLILNFISNLGASAFTVLWEYSDGGGGWPDLTTGTDIFFYSGDETEDPTDDLDFWETSGTTRAKMVAVGGFDDWDTDAIDGDDIYWLRARITAITGGIVGPTQADQVAYAQTQPHIEFANSQIAGDVPALVNMVMKMPAGQTGTTPNLGSISRLIMGARSRDLTANRFTSHLNAGNADNPTGWAVTYQEGASATADSEAPGGIRAAVPFSANPTSLNTRLTYTNTDGIVKFDGRFRSFIRAQQIGGAAGDISLQLQTELTSNASPPTIKSSEVTMAAADAGGELVDTGIINLPFMDIVKGDSVGGQLVFKINAKRASGTATLRVYDLILIPADEWIGVFDDPVLDETSTIRGINQFSIDSGIFAPRAHNTLLPPATSPVVTWTAMSKLPTLQPATQYRIYYLMAYYNGAFGTGPLLSDLGSGASVSVEVHSRYSMIRGAS